jgi:cardiolipin synthase
MDSQESKKVRELSDEAFSRAAGAFLIPGNRIELLKDSEENYPAWIKAIESAEKWIHFETYIIHEDEVGRRFAALLAEKARQGVKVRLLYDYLGSLLKASRRFWRRLSEQGVDVRCFNPPRLDSPLGWVNRDHRKMIGVDGRVAFVTGLCVGRRWVGYPDQGIDAWRDTGVQIEGPAIAEIERAFAGAWDAAGNRLSSKELPAQDSIEAAGRVGVRVVATVPSVGGIYRVDQLIATLAQRSIWLSDAYFIGTSSYVQALCAAAQSGVDVRLLIPTANDIPVMRAVARAGLRPLLEAGVRVFEWNGSMMHAKTAVADGKWARVGSTNLNLTSWLGNWELDVIVEDGTFAAQMEEMYLDDQSRSTEIVLGTKRRRPLPAGNRVRSGTKRSGAGRTAAGVIRLSNAIGAAVSNRRNLGAAEAVIMFWGAAILIVISTVMFLWPRAVVFPLASFGVWVALSLLVRAYKLWRIRHSRRV